MQAHCEECGDAIPAKRLRAIPTATRCVPCQSIVDTRVRPEQIPGAMAAFADFDGEMIGEIASSMGAQ